jgi:5-methylcytosine-specific restriction endonuclease McrA
MIKIQINNIEEIAHSFVDRIEISIKKNKLSQQDRNALGDNLFADGNDLQKNIHELYLTKPELLLDANQNFTDYLNNNFTQQEIDEIKENYFDYDSVINYKKYRNGMHSYWLMQKLDIRVCPYCNRSYTFTINKNNKKIRPEFDHFHPKDTYPFLALSFYNLVPSCPICNHTKKTSEISIHPYIEGFDNNCKFKIKKIEECLLDDDYSKWEIFFDNTNNRFNRNIDVLALKELYNEHKDFVSEIVFKARAYNDDVYKSVIETFTHQGLTEKEMNLLIFGTYLEENEIGLRPLSKLSKDIIEQIGVE